jgi:hypothetical protein
LTREQYAGAWYDPRPDVMVGLSGPQSQYSFGSTGAGASYTPYPGTSSLNLSGAYSNPLCP